MVLGKRQPPPLRTHQEALPLSICWCRERADRGVSTTVSDLSQQQPKWMVPRATASGGDPRGRVPWRGSSVKSRRFLIAGHLLQRPRPSGERPHSGLGCA
jgi:hypothetical protein